MKFCFLFEAPAAEQALMPVPQEYCLPQGLRPISGALLVIGAFWRRLAGFDGLQKLGVEFSHLEGCLRNGNYFHKLFKQAYLRLQLVSDPRRQPSFLFGCPPIVKTRFPISQPVPSLPAVFPPCVMPFGFVSEKIPLFAHIFVLL